MHVTKLLYRFVVATSTKKSTRIIYVVNMLSLNKHLLIISLGSRHTEVTPV